MSGYHDPDAVFLAAGGSGVKVDPYDRAFGSYGTAEGDSSLPAIYLFSNSHDVESSPRLKPGDS